MSDREGHAPFVNGRTGMHLRVEGFRCRVVKQQLLTMFLVRGHCSREDLFVKPMFIRNLMGSIQSACSGEIGFARFHLVGLLEFRTQSLRSAT